ncbi:MAG: hypothetical protein PVJ38_07260 [Candidatus Bathyarchaeota archaeon]|jgi:Zn-dependent protease with chaperone function
MWRLKARLRPALALHFIIHLVVSLGFSWVVLSLIFRFDPVSVTAAGFLLAVVAIVIEWVLGPTLISSLLKPRWIRKEGDPVLWSLIEKEAEMMEREVSRVGIIDAKTPNALVVSTIRGQSQLFFTRGLLASLNYREVRSVIVWMLGASDSGFLGAATMFSGLLALSYRLTGGYIKSRIRGEGEDLRDKTAAALGYIPFALTLSQSVRATRPMALVADERVLAHTGDPASLLTALLKVVVGTAGNLRGENRSTLTPVKGLLFVDPTLALRDCKGLIKAAQSYGVETDRLLGASQDEGGPVVGEYHVFEWFLSQPSPIERFRRAVNLGKSIRSPIKIGLAWIE